MPICEKPFAKAAKELGVAEETLLAQLGSWLEDGALRRIGAVCRHRKLGFEGNAMCVWQAPPESLEEKASLLAKSPNVSHCCERKTSEAFPFNLYAMLHAPDAQGAGRLFEKLSAEAALPQGRMLRTKAELKKSSPVFY
jgi:DNA-binding Lrp family transcriptional regulator